MGFGFGFAASGLYNTDDGISSKLQLRIGGQYWNTKSLHDAIQAKTGVDSRLDLVRTSTLIDVK